MENIILIPAYNPDSKLVNLVNELKIKTNYKIIIVNDGSLEAISMDIFKICSNVSIILNHEKNLGKGEAIKTGLKYIYKTFKKTCHIVTADADGQHKVCDIVKVANATSVYNNSLILGSRYFTGKIPLRSRFGNNLTKLIFQLTTHKKLIDTQTGLRGFPYNLIPILLNIDGSRYEYEMNVLLEMIHKNINIKEIKIETIYLNNNSSSHFHIIKDSFLIYKKLLERS